MVNKFLIKPEVEQEIKYIVDKCDKEVSGIGIVEVINGQLVVTRQFLLEQEVGPAHTDLDAAAIAKIEFSLLQQGIDAMLCFWWHSHVNMGAFWSGQDLTTIKEMGQKGLCLATVYNKKGESKSAIAYKTDSIFSSDLMLNEAASCELYYEGLSDSKKAELDALIASNVKAKVYTPTASSYPTQTYFGDYQSKYDNQWWDHAPRQSLDLNPQETTKKALKNVRRALNQKIAISQKVYSDLFEMGKAEGISSSTCHEAAACGILPSHYEAAFHALTKQDLVLIDQKITDFEMGEAWGN